MLTFEVKDMTCGHCVSTITKAVEAADPGARVQIDLAAHRVQIQPVSSDRTRLRPSHLGGRLHRDGRCACGRRRAGGQTERLLLRMKWAPAGSLCLPGTPTRTS